GSECADAKSTLLGGRRTDAALEVDRGGTEPGTGAPEREIEPGTGGGSVPQLPVWRIATPLFVVPAQQVEQDGGRHDRHARDAHRKAAALLEQPGLHARRRVEA